MAPKGACPVVAAAAVGGAALAGYATYRYFNTETVDVVVFADGSTRGHRLQKTSSLDTLIAAVEAELLSEGARLFFIQVIYKLFAILLCFGASISSASCAAASAFFCCLLIGRLPASLKRKI